MQDTEYAYIAGFIDGEGSIGLRTSHSSDGRTPSYVARLRITNTNPDVLNWIHIATGIGLRTVKPNSNNNYQVYEWYVAGLQMKSLLEGILPFLKVKKLQAETLLKFLETVQPKEGQSKKLTSEVIDFRNKLRDDLDKHREVGLLRIKDVV